MMLRVSSTHVTSHENRPHEYPEHESVVLKVNVVDNDETWMKEQRDGHNSLHTRINSTANKAIDYSEMREWQIEDLT